MPSIETLAKIATALNMPLQRFFPDRASDLVPHAPGLSGEEMRFLGRIRHYSPSLIGSDRKLLVEMVKKMAANAQSSKTITGIRL